MSKHSAIVNNGRRVAAMEEHEGPMWVVLSRPHRAAVSHEESSEIYRIVDISWSRRSGSWDRTFYSHMWRPSGSDRSRAGGKNSDQIFSVANLNPSPTNRAPIALVNHDEIAWLRRKCACHPSGEKHVDDARCNSYHVARYAQCGRDASQGLVHVGS